MAKMPIIHFSRRRKLARLYEEWAKRCNAKDCPESVIAYLVLYDLLDVDQTLKHLEEHQIEQPRSDFFV